MINALLCIVLFVIFTILGGIHFYWLFGGTWGLKQAIPTKTNEPNNLSIPNFATLVVSIILISFGLIYLFKSEILSFHSQNWLTKYGYQIIPYLFLIRAIGEFKYVGFFKKIKNTEFSKADTKIFSPLCLIIGIIGITILLITKS